MIQFLPVSDFTSSTSMYSSFALNDASAGMFLSFFPPQISFKLDCWGGTALIFFGIVTNSPRQLSVSSCNKMTRSRTQCLLASHASERQTANCHANATLEHKQTRLTCQAAKIYLPPRQTAPNLHAAQIHSQCICNVEIWELIRNCYKFIRKF